MHQFPKTKTPTPLQKTTVQQQTSVALTEEERLSAIIPQTAGKNMLSHNLPSPPNNPSRLAGKVLVKQFNEDVDVRPTTKHVIARGESLYKAAKVLLKEAKISAAQREKLLKQIENAFADYRKKIEEELNIDSPLRTPHASLDDQFKSLYPKIMEQLHALHAKLSEQIYHAYYEQNLVNKITTLSSTKDKAKENFQEGIAKELKKAQKLLINKEIEIISNTPRDSLFNEISITDSDCSLISAQNPATQKTTPCSVIDSGNRNFVVSSVTVNNNGKLNVVDKDFRLGAICAYGIDDELQRRKQNASNAKELIQVVTAHQIAAKGQKDGEGTQDNPIIIDLFSLTLITPLSPVVDQAAKLAGTPSELTMIAEHNQALMLYHNRVLPLTVTLPNGEQKQVFVKPNISHTNIPTNLKEFKTRIIKNVSHMVVNNLQNDINAKGFYNYFNYAEKYLANSHYLNEKKESRQTVQGLGNLYLATHLIADNIARFQKAMYADEAVSKAQKELVQAQKKYEAKLAENNEMIEKLLEMIEAKRKTEPKLVKPLIEEYTKIIADNNHINVKLYEKYHNLEKAKKAILEKAEIKNMIDENYESLAVLLSVNKARLATPEGQKLRQELLVAQSYFTNIRLYYNNDNAGNYKTKENAFVMQAGMHLTLFAADINHTSGCKSAKDRTGLLNIYKEAMTIYMIKHGKYPDPLNQQEFKELQEIIKSNLFKFASAYNSEQNCPGAFGLQISLPQPQYSPAKQMGVLAKKATSYDIKDEINLDPLVDSALNNHSYELFDDVSKLLTECVAYSAAIAEESNVKQGLQFKAIHGSLMIDIQTLIKQYEKSLADQIKNYEERQSQRKDKEGKHSNDEHLIRNYEEQKLIVKTEFNLVVLRHMLENSEVLEKSLADSRQRIEKDKITTQRNGRKFIGEVYSSKNADNLLKYLNRFKMAREQAISNLKASDVDKLLLSRQRIQEQTKGNMASVESIIDKKSNIAGRNRSNAIATPSVAPHRDGTSIGKHS